ncbi:MAG TPA: DNA polymerase III subunit gamma/tau [Gammaproteobacteria bacterium]|nr:DNA polymerase III subunit gamma/tau [Gammaproteobacteria bacterium]
MAYLALARRYRPRNFEEVVGQQHVVRALANALDGARLHHAYLFAGTRGVGKTTIARILARCLNCEKGVSSHPCGECGACRAIDAGRFLDLIEVDAASRTKVEDTRDLLENVPYAPAEGRFKVYLVDEVHMLSNHSFNALLKTLEEPPEHVKFLFATTDPEKVPATVLSRCLVFTLHRLATAEIEGALARIVEKEGLVAEPAALAAIARAGRGSLRDALSLLDQALAFGGSGGLTAAEAATMLGMTDRGGIYDLLDRLAADDGRGLLARLAEILGAASGVDDILDALAETLALVARRQLVAEAPLAADVPAQRVDALAHALTPEEVQLDYDIVLAGKQDLDYAPDPTAALEMTLLRMLAFRPQPDSAGGESRRPATRARSVAAKPGTAPGGKVSGEDWEAILSRLKIGGMLRELAGHCTLAGRDDNIIRLRLDARGRELLTPRLQAGLEAALADELGAGLKLKIEIGETAAPTPAARRSAREAERQARAEEEIARDPQVAKLRETFGAELIPDSIRPED